MHDVYIHRASKQEKEADVRIVWKSTKQGLTISNGLTIMLTEGRNSSYYRDKNSKRFDIYELINKRKSFWVCTMLMN